jgi:hypothetical protein
VTLVRRQKGQAKGAAGGAGDVIIENVAILAFSPIVFMVGGKAGGGPFALVPPHEFTATCGLATPSEKKNAGKIAVEPISLRVSVNPPSSPRSAGFRDGA